MASRLPFRKTLLCVALTLVWLQPTTPAHAITLGQVDDFQDGTTQSWAIGRVLGDPNPRNAADGGPQGAGDSYVEYTSNGGGIGGRMIFYNEAQWAGDYIAAGVTQIDADVINLSEATPLSVRVAFGTEIFWADGDWFASTDPIELAPGGGWTSVSFPIDEASMTQVTGVGSYADAMSSIRTMRILSSLAPASRGDAIVATIGVDNLFATAAVTAVEGDFSGDGRVNNEDLNLLLNNWGQATVPAEWTGAFTSPVNNDELNPLLNGWGTGTSVPEPRAALLAALAVAAVGRRR
ncbi:MAG: hypothetical protein AAFV43_02390 [Planctomycetota bacterium]